jgi:hypothetical protein
VYVLFNKNNKNNTYNECIIMWKEEKHKTQKTKTKITPRLKMIQEYNIKLEIFIEKKPDIFWLHILQDKLFHTDRWNSLS